MIRLHSPKTDFLFLAYINNYVPAGWKLWAMVFKAIAEGHYDDLHTKLEEGDVELVDDVSFSTSISGLYQETCCDARQELPSSFRDLPYEERQKVLFGLKIVAEDIIDSFNAAKPLLPDDCPEMGHFESVVRNCRVVVSLGEKEWNGGEDKVPPLEYEYFGSEMQKALHELVNGVCIEEIDCNTFGHILECDNEYYYDRLLDVEDIKIGDEIFSIPGNIESVWEDYSDSKIVPVAGFGMAMYALLLHMISMRQSVGEAPQVYNGEIVQDEPWEQKFRGRIDWNKNGYSLEEESWKDAYLSPDHEPPAYEIEQYSSELLSMLCGRRVFEETFSEVNFEDIIDAPGDFSIGFEQYKFIHDNGDRLQSLYDLLVQETEFLYANLEKIADCFKGKSRAEDMRMASKWRLEEKNKNSEHIHVAYPSSAGIHHEAVQRILFERYGLAYEHLEGQPFIYAELVEEYIQRCIVQDERLKAEISRARRDSHIPEAKTEQISATAEKDKVVNETIRKLQDRKIIDADCNILLKKEGGKYYKTTELTNFLVRNEIVVPSKGWVSAIISLKVMTRYDFKVDGHFKEEFYRERTGLHKALRWCSKELDWSAFIDVFRLQGNKLKDTDLHYYFTSNNEERERILAGIVRKYDQSDNATSHKAISTRG